MQQKFFSVIYKLKYYRTFVEISFDFESVCRFVKCSAYALNICNRNQKIGQNMQKVILKRKKFQIYLIIIIIVTIATWLTQNYPYSKKAFFSELSTYDHIMPIASPSVFNLGNYFQPHFCHEVSEVHPHILAVDTISRDLFSYSLFWPWRDTGASMVTFYLWHIFNKHKMAATQKWASL